MVTAGVTGEMGFPGLHFGYDSQRSPFSVSIVPLQRSTWSAAHLILYQKFHQTPTQRVWSLGDKEGQVEQRGSETVQPL